jgi:hypothetical protein
MRAAQIKNTPSRVQDEGALVVPPAFAAENQQPQFRNNGSAGLLTIRAKPYPSAGNLLP